MTIRRGSQRYWICSISREAACRPASAYVIDSDDLRVQEFVSGVFPTPQLQRLNTLLQNTGFPAPNASAYRWRRLQRGGIRHDAKDA